MINDNLQNKKYKYEALVRKLTTKYTNQIAEIEKVIDTIENNACINENDSLETIVYKKYLELENVYKVSNYINDLGHRIKTQSHIGERKYTPNDITEIITSDADVETNLKEVVQDLQDRNYNAVSKIWR